MIKWTKHQIPESIREYSELLQKAGKDNWNYSHEKFGYMFFSKREVKKANPKNISFEDTLFYDIQKARQVCKFIDDDGFRNSYIEFRKVRKEKHKDTMTERAEHMLFTKLGRFHRLVAIDMLNEAVQHEWKSVYEDKTRAADILAKVKEQEERENKQAENIKIRQESQKVKESKQKLQEMIKKTGKSKEYWEEKAKQEIRLERGIKEEFIGYLLPTKVRKMVQDHLKNS